jgi:hypothetical protein
LTGDDFNDVFGGKPKPPSFAERVAKPDAPAAGGEAGEASVGSGPYKPYGYLPSGNIGLTCDAQRWLEKTEIAEGTEFQYRFLMRVDYVGEEQIKLFLPDCIVVIEGMYLKDLRRKLARRQVTFIQQYPPKVWPTPPPKGEPVIENISVVRPDPVVTVGKNS